jgi:hypothetical protein
MIALPANAKGIMVRALSTGRIAAKLTFTVYVPIAAVSAKLPLTGPGTYTGFFINPKTVPIYYLSANLTTYNLIHKSLLLQHQLLNEYHGMDRPGDVPPPHK